MKIARGLNHSIQVTLSLQESKEIGVAEDDDTYDKAKIRALRYWERNYRTFDRPWDVTAEIYAHSREGGYLIESISVADIIRSGKATSVKFRGGDLTRPIEDKNR